MIHKLLQILIACLLLSSSLSTIKAQEVSATLDSTHYLIGDWIPLELKVVVPNNTIVDWPIIDVTIDEIEVLKRTEIDSIITKENKTYFQELTLTVFDSGYYPIPAFDFVINEDTFSTEAKLVIVSTVALDTANLDVKAIKPPLDAPLTFMDVFWPFGAIALLVLILIGVALYFMLRKKPEKEKVEIPKIIVPAHQWAFEELEKLKAENLWQSGNIKAYYSKLSNILRGYIELRYKQPALESTSDEIMHRLKLLKLDQHLLEKVQSSLTLSDFVKFAKAKPLANEHEESFNTVFEFVDITKIIEVKEDKTL